MIQRAKGVTGKSGLQSPDCIRKMNSNKRDRKKKGSTASWRERAGLGSYAYSGNVDGRHQLLPRWARLPRSVGEGGKEREARREEGAGHAIHVASQSFPDSLGSESSYAASLSASDFQVSLAAEGVARGGDHCAIKGRHFATRDTSTNLKTK